MSKAKDFIIYTIIAIVVLIIAGVVGLLFYSSYQATAEKERLAKNKADEQARIEAEKDAAQKKIEDEKAAKIKAEEDAAKAEKEAKEAAMREEALDKYSELQLKDYADKTRKDLSIIFEGEAESFSGEKYGWKKIDLWFIGVDRLDKMAFTPHETLAEDFALDIVEAKFGLKVSPEKRKETSRGVIHLVLPERIKVMLVPVEDDPKKFQEISIDF